MKLAQNDGKHSTSRIAPTTLPVAVDDDDDEEANEIFNWNQNKHNSLWFYVEYMGFASQIAFVFHRKLSQPPSYRYSV